MKLIIDINENEYKALINDGIQNHIALADELIKNGTPYTERPQGEWNYIQAGMCVCQFCGAMPHKEYKNFCAKCGADMRGEEND